MSKMMTVEMMQSIGKESIKVADSIGANMIHAVVKTVTDNPFAVGMMIAGGVANELAEAFDLDTPLSVIGAEDLGLDAFVDNAGDLFVLGAGAKLAVDLVINTKEALFNPLSEDKLRGIYCGDKIKLVEE